MADSEMMRGRSGGRGKTREIAPDMVPVMKRPFVVLDATLIGWWFIPVTI